MRTAPSKSANLSNGSIGIDPGCVERRFLARRVLGARC
jgi:hypothetical protein